MVPSAGMSWSARPCVMMIFPPPARNRDGRREKQAGKAPDLPPAAHPLQDALVIVDGSIGRDELVGQAVRDDDLPTPGAKSGRAARETGGQSARPPPCRPSAARRACNSRWFHRPG